MKLLAGERYALEEKDTAYLLTSGQAEAYAVMAGGGRRLFLMELAPGAAAFPSMDEFEEITVEIYAASDVELTEIPLSEDESAANLMPLMLRWFRELVNLPWLRLIADRGDDVLKTWVDGSVFERAAQDGLGIMEAFAENEGIFSVLADVQFIAQDTMIESRTSARIRQKQRKVDETIANFLGEETVAAADSVQGGAKLEEAVLLVRTVAHYLRMPEEDIALNPETVKRLEPLGILRRLVAKGGMEMRLIKLETGWEKSDCGVMLGYFGEKKSLVALIPESSTGYRMVTGEKKEGVPITADMAKSLGEDAFLIYPGLPSKKLNRRDFLQFMVRHTWKSDTKTILFASLIMGIVPLLTPVVTETMFSDLIPILDRQGLATVTQVVMVAGFTTAALATVRSWAVIRLTSVGSMAAGAALLGRILKLPTEFFRRYQSGELAERMRGVDEAAMLLSGDAVGAILSCLCSFWSLGLMCYYSAKLTGIALLIWLAYMLVSGWLLYRLTGEERQMTAAKNKTSGILMQIFTGLTKFRTKGAEEHAYHLWGKLFTEEFRHSCRVRQLKNYSKIIDSVQPILLSLVLYYFGLMEVAAAMGGAESAAKTLGLGGEPMTAATFIAFQSAFTAFNTSLTAILPVLQTLSVLKPRLDNLLPILETEPESAEDRTEAGELSGVIEVRNLTFGYLEGKDVLRDVSFSIAAGEHVAIVGKSGCGKSTLIRLILGFETPRAGAVFYDGQDLSELALPSVRSQMGVVMQNGQLMSGDILHNIIGTNDLTLEDAWQAAEAAGIADDIREMPMQMNTMVSEGSTNISGGQRQRILIARALALKPAIIICDEATSALDNRTQAIVTRSLDKLHATQIIVAHRLSTIRNADRIIVLDRGRVAESGTFDELVAKGGLFASFANRQTA